MQPIEAFTAITTIIDGRQRRARYDALTGLTVEGLNANEARLVLVALEALDQPTLVAIAQGQRVGPLAAAPAPAPTPRPASENAQTAAPQPPKPSPAPEPPAQPAQPAHDAPAKASSEPVAASHPLAGGNPPGPTLDAPTGQPAHTSATPANEPTQTAPEPPAADPEPPAPRLAVVDTEKPRKRGPKKPPPKPGERPRVEPRLPEPGDEFDGVLVTATKDHRDGGRLLILADGVRVRVDASGAEVARVDGSLPDSDEDEAGTVTADTMHAPAPANTSEPPPEVMQTRMTREVIQWLVDHGVKDKDAIMARCIELKSKGALAFEASKDEEAVRRRVNSSLTVMGLR